MYNYQCHSQELISQSRTYLLIEQVKEIVEQSDTIYFRIAEDDTFRFNSHSEFILRDSLTYCLSSIHFLFDSESVNFWYEFEQCKNDKDKVYTLVKVTHPRLGSKRMKIKKIRL